MKRSRLGIIDVGSNTIRSLIVETSPDGNYTVLDDERETVRLAAGLDRYRRLSHATMTRAVTALKRMKEIAKARGVKRISVVGTSAIRSARNRSVFIQRIRKETGLRIRVISGVEEARLAFESAAFRFNFGQQPCAVIDLGGGSCELVLAMGNHIEHIYSFEMGAVSFSEAYLKSDPVKQKEFKGLRQVIRKTLKAAEVPRDIPIQFVVASGGTANSLAQMSMVRKGLEGRSSQGYEMTQSEVFHLLEALVRRNLDDRKKMAGLAPDRADIIIAGVTILYEIMNYLHVNRIRVSTGGIRHAILNRMIRPKKEREQALQRGGRIDAAEVFARSLNVEWVHANHVRKLALSIFDQIAESIGLDNDTRDFLEAAALLHDIGSVVSYKGHHKHSYHLIAHASLDGFSPDEVEIIAQIARYHRAAFPKKKHREFKALNREDRNIVLRMAAILRIADGLERRHSQGVKEVRCRVNDRRITFGLVSSRDLEVEMYGAVDKAGLFEEVFGREVRFEQTEARSVPDIRALKSA